MTRPSGVPSAREPLPLDVSGLPPLPPDAARTLRDGLATMGLAPSPGVLAAIDAHVRLLEAWGRHINLTAIRAPVEVVRLHVLDSLSAVGPIHERVPDARSLVDIGSGGGYPGIPVALAGCLERLTLVESVGRKARFLEVASRVAMASLGEGRAPVTEVLPVRGESLAAGDRRAAWDVATIRAVGTLAECAELGLPLLRVGGLLVCWKREAADAHGAGLRAEMADALGLIGHLGGGTPEVVPAGVPGAPGHRLVLVHKGRSTPPGYPRAPAERRGSPTRPSRGPRGSRRGS